MAFFEGGRTPRANRRQSSRRACLAMYRHRPTWRCVINRWAAAHAVRVPSRLRTQPRVNRIGVSTARGREFESFWRGSERNRRGCGRAGGSSGANGERGHPAGGPQRRVVGGFTTIGGGTRFAPRRQQESRRNSRRLENLPKAVVLLTAVPTPPSRRSSFGSRTYRSRTARVAATTANKPSKSPWGPRGRSRTATWAVCRVACRPAGSSTLFRALVARPDRLGRLSRSVHRLSSRRSAKPSNGDASSTPTRSPTRPPSPAEKGSPAPASRRFLPCFAYRQTHAAASWLSQTAARQLAFPNTHYEKSSRV